MEIIPLILTFFIGVAASFIGAMVGSGGLISIPFLIFLGLPPHVAIATNKLGATGLHIGATKKFLKEKTIVWKYVIPLIIVDTLGLLVGTQILISIDEKLLSIIVGIILLVLLPLIFIHKRTGVERTDKSKMMITIGYVTLFFIGIWSGFFGGGAATFMQFAMMYFFGMTIIDISSTIRLPALVADIIGVAIFAVYGIINFQLGIALFLGMLVGGYLGAHTMIKKGNGFVKILLAVVVVASAIKLLFS